MNNLIYEDRDTQIETLKGWNILELHANRERYRVFKGHCTVEADIVRYNRLISYIWTELERRTKIK